MLRLDIKLIIKGAKEIIVLDEIRYDNEEEFFNDLTLGDKYGLIAVNWAEGIVFQHQSFPWTETTIREYIEKDRLYFSFIKYAPMKEYKERITKNGMLIVIRKIKTPILVSVAKELKKRLGEHT